MKRTLMALLLVGPALLAAPATLSPKAASVVGCKETKVFHKSTCKWVKEIDKAKTRVDFASVDEAKKAGMKPCEDCKP